MAQKIRVRIAVAVGPSGDWNSSGWRGAGKPPRDDKELAGNALDGLNDEPGRVTFVEADVPLPEETGTVEGKVTA